MTHNPGPENPMTEHAADGSPVDVVETWSPNGLAPPTRSLAADLDEPPPPPLPRTRRRRLPIATLVLALLAVGAAGFFVGVKVEKSKVPARSTAATNPLAAFAAGGLPTGTTGTTARPSGAAGTGTTGPTGAAPTGAAGTGAGAVGGAANIIGTVTVVDGTTLYVTDTTGNTVKVTTTNGTTVTKTVTGKVADLTPGESVVIRGVQSSDGIYAAQSVTQGTAGAFAGGFGGGRGTRAAPAAPTASAAAKAGN